MADSVQLHRQLLSRILRKEVTVPAQSLQIDTENDDVLPSESHLLLHSGFICYFLNFLRQSSTPVLQRSENVVDAGADNVSKSQIGAAENDFHGAAHKRQLHTPYKGQRMSTPKFRDDIMAPKSTQLLSYPSIQEDISSQRSFHSMHDSSPHAGRGSNRGKKTLSLSDFISSNAGGNPQSNRKKQRSKPIKTKKGLRKSTCRTEDSPYANNSTSFQQSNVSPHFRLPAHDPKSPVNPLYSEASRTISFDVSEEFPPLGQESPSASALRPPRRIKPTAVCPAAVVDSTINDTGKNSPFMSASTISTSGKVDLQLERELLKQKRFEQGETVSKTVGQTDNHQIIAFKTPDKSINISPVKRATAELNPCHVCGADKISRLSEVYSYYINAFFVPSITTELQFVIDLLCSPCSSADVEAYGTVPDITGSLCNSSDSYSEDAVDKEVDDVKILSTTANAIYFAVQVIHSLVLSGIISIITHSVLSILAQNRSIQSFQPSLPDEIMKLVEELDARDRGLSTEKYSSQEQLHSLFGVPFEAEMDDRSNFTSDRSFHAFRKHRDSFYCILREYEEKRLHSNFSVSQHLGAKIKSLVMQVISVGTNRPFTRLFVSQMLLGTNRDHSIQQSDRGLGENSFGRLDLVASLRRGDPEKFRRLQSRFVTASTPVSGVVTDLIEERCQFYKGFVLCADSYAFCIHLRDELRRRIADIESQQAQQILDEVTAESVNTSSVSSALSQIVTSLKILGRFFGFLMFQPYASDDCTTQNYEPAVLEHVTSSLDRAKANGHLLFTIPWTTEYLKSANFPCISVESSNERRLIKTFFSIHKAHSMDHNEALTSGDMLICLAICSLLEMPIFPEGQFYQLLGNHPCSCPPKTHHFPRIESETDFTCKVNMDSNPTLDIACSNLIPLSIIYETHLPLKEIRYTLLSCNSDVSSKSPRSRQPPRKIKPSTEIKMEDGVPSRKDKQLQSLLEDHFFNGQPSSLKRTVSFVAERCASNCVKHIRSVSMLDVCAEAENIFLERRKSVPLEEFEGNVKTVVREIVADMNVKATERMLSESKSFCEKAVPQCMKDLSSCETADGVLEVATRIAKKRAVASVNSWLTRRLDELVTVSVKARLSKVSSTTLDDKTPPRLPILNAEGLGCASSVLQTIDSLSSLLHVMKEYIVKLTFANKAAVPCPRGVQRPRSHEPLGSRVCGAPFCLTLSMDPSLPACPNEDDVSAVLNVASTLLCGDALQMNCGLSDAILHSIKMQLDSSPHLRNCLDFTTNELSTRSQRASLWKNSDTPAVGSGRIEVAEVPVLCG